MPNYCYNRVVASKEVLDEIFDGNQVTFQKITPMPKELNLTEGSITEEAVVFAMSKKKTEDFLKLKEKFEDKKELFDKNYWNKIQSKFSDAKLQELESKAKRYVPDKDAKEIGIKTFKQLGDTYINNYFKYGHMTWYDWCVENWGTKWDAMDTNGSPEEGELIFYTAWNEPRPIIKKLMEKYKNRVIEWEYEEEGNNRKGIIRADGEGNIEEKELECERYDEEETED